MSLTHYFKDSLFHYIIVYYICTSYNDSHEIQKNTIKIKR